MAPISPRSSNYERLEGGMGPSRTGTKRFAWKKFAIGAAVLIGLVWFFGPRETRNLTPWTSQDKENGERLSVYFIELSLFEKVEVACIGRRLSLHAMFNLFLPF